MAVTGDRELRDRLGVLDAASLCDAAARTGAAVGVCDADIDLISAGTGLIGRARPVVCDVDFLDVFKALSETEEGEVLVVQGPRDRAVVGELFATEARRRGLAGIVVDGLVRDAATLRGLDFPVFARGTTPRAGATQAARGPFGTASVGGVLVARGDLVFGDADGVIVIPDGAVGDVLPVAEEIQRVEGEILEAVRGGRSLFEHTNLEEHYGKRAGGQQSTLGLTPPSGT